MITRTTISSISYNTIPFFTEKVKALTSGDSPAFDWVHWVVHQPEEDEKKAHIHFVCQPSRQMDTNSIRQEFVEPADMYVREKIKRGETITEQDLKPLGCLPFNKTKSLRDWLLYAIHDVKYLLTKGEMRKHTYTREDVKSTAPDMLTEEWRGTLNPLSVLLNRVIEMRAANMTLGDILATGMIPTNMYMLVREVYYTANNTKRNGEGHE